MPGEPVREMLIEAVEKRFGTVESVPSGHTLEFLSDNGGAYIAVQTRQIARQLGLKPVTTPVCSPQSNGMAESFVNTFRRDLSQPHGPERRFCRDAAAACGVRALQRGASPLVTKNEVSSGIQARPGKAMPKSTGAIGVKLRINRVRLYGGKINELVGIRNARGFA